jgi:hypothetical protein
MSFAIGLVVGMLVGAGLVYWAKEIEKDIGKFTEYDRE